jgi:hypothetical protein
MPKAGWVQVFQTASPELQITNQDKETTVTDRIISIPESFLKSEQVDHSTVAQNCFFYSTFRHGLKVKLEILRFGHSRYTRLSRITVQADITNNLSGHVYILGYHILQSQGRLPIFWGNMLTPSW